MIPARDPLELATWLAATVGSFDPATLIQTVTQNSTSRRALAAQLAPLCHEVSSPGSMKWRLAAEPRRRALRDLDKHKMFRPRTVKELLSKLPLEPEDRFGLYLRNALTGASSSPAETAELDTLRTAYEFVGRAAVGVDPAAARSLADIAEQEAHRAHAEKELARSVGPAFVGRARELVVLREFAQTGYVIDRRFTKAPRGGLNDPPIVLLEGIGGTGKSALIAKLVTRLRGEGRAAVILDLDRPALASLDFIELTRELVWQLALSYPQIAAPLAEIRRDVYSSLSRSERLTSNVADAYSIGRRSLYGINAGLGEVIRSAHLQFEPVLIVLDTFEEVLIRGGRLLSAMIEWLEDLRFEGQLRELRVIISGRAMHTDLYSTCEGFFSASDYIRNVVGGVRLGNLRQQDAVSSLRLRGVTPSLGRELVKVFGSNALVVRLLGDYCEQKGERATRSLISAKDKGRAYRTVIAQRILYSRILGRIRDDAAVRALASPGLVVRTVTPGVIRNVLAEPCGLGSISAARALELFVKLAAHVWLVRQIGERVIVHRRDIRALMLPLAAETLDANAKASLVKRVKAIHRNAFRYHSSQSADPDLSPEMQRSEALYHHLFLDPEKALASLDADAVLPSLGSYLNDFPAEIRARIKRRTGRALSGKEQGALTLGERALYVAELEAEQIRRTGVSDFNLSLRRLPRIAQPLAQEIQSSVVSGFAACEFEDVADFCEIAFTSFVDSVLREGVKALQPEMSGHYAWLPALAALAGTPKLLDLAGMAALVEENWPSLIEAPLPDDSGFTVAHFAAAICVLLAWHSGRQADIVKVTQRLSIDLRLSQVAATSMGSLRTYQMISLGSGRAPSLPRLRYVEMSLLQYFAKGANPESRDVWHTSTSLALNAWSRAYELPASPSRSMPLNLIGLSALDKQLSGGRLRDVTWEQIRGMSSELHAPALTALREYCGDYKQARRLLLRLDLLSDGWLRDLAEGPSSDNFLATLCYLVDRLGAFRELFHFAPAGSPGASVARIFDRYQAILMRGRPGGGNDL